MIITCSIDQTKNISRYIGRYDASDKYYISSNLETVFANLIQRKYRGAFEEKIIPWQKKNECKWEDIFEKLNKWLVTKGIWKDYAIFRKVIVEGIDRHAHFLPVNQSCSSLVLKIQHQF